MILCRMLFFAQYQLDIRPNSVQKYLFFQGSFIKIGAFSLLLRDFLFIKSVFLMTIEQKRSNTFVIDRYRCFHYIRSILVSFTTTSTAEEVMAMVRPMKGEDLR